MEHQSLIQCNFYTCAMNNGALTFTENILPESKTKQIFGIYSNRHRAINICFLWCSFPVFKGHFVSYIALQATRK